MLNWFKSKISQFFKEAEPDPMKYLIVGLGNMGYDYDDTRHNIGFDVVDYLAKEFSLTYKNATLGDVAEFKHKGRTFVLLKPSTFMNLSGKAVRYWMTKHQVEQANVLIILDDLNLPYGRQRIKGKGSDGGHNGLKDINRALGNQNYARLRLGIGNDYHKGQQANFVLGKWTKEERETLPNIIKTAVETTKAFGTIGLKFTMEKFNKKGRTSSSGGKDELTNKIINNKTNEAVFSFLKLKKEKIKITRFQRNELNEGGVHLLTKLGKKLPNKTKYSIGNLNVLVNNISGEIFAVHYRKFSFFIKPSFEKLNLDNADNLRKGKTLDGDIDISALGDAWVLLSNIEEGIHDQALMQAYQATK